MFFKFLSSVMKQTNKTYTFFPIIEQDNGCYGKALIGPLEIFLDKRKEVVKTLKQLESVDFFDPLVKQLTPQEVYIRVEYHTEYLRRLDVFLDEKAPDWRKNYQDKS
jgi:glucuronate isomerase